MSHYAVTKRRDFSLRFVCQGEFGCRHYNLNNLRWRDLLARLVFLILGLLSEAALRVAHAAQVLPAPNMGEPNPELGIKVARLDALAKAKGKIDCIFIGSSAVDADVDPQVMAEVFRTRAGDDLICFNFALAAMPTASAEMISKMLITRYHPKNLALRRGDPLSSQKIFPTLPIACLGCRTKPVTFRRKVC